MTTAELLKLHKETCDKCYGIVQKKNNDYSGGATSSDALANFKMSTALGLSPVMGLLLRIQDKMMRIKTFDTDGALGVSEETVNDAFEDIINYAVLGKALMLERKSGSDGLKGTAKDTVVKLKETLSSSPKAKAVPKNVIARAINRFESGFIYFGDLAYFIDAANRFATFLTEEEINDNIQICELTSEKVDGESFLLVAVRKNSRLYIALSGLDDEDKAALV